MEIAPEQEHDQAIAVAQEDEQAIALPQEDPSSRQLKGIRLREWGKWVSEIRMPNCRRKIWLGSYKAPEQAARAYDAAMYFLRGPKYQFFNFPDSVPGNPSASPLSPKQIKEAARKYALGQPLSSLPSLENSIEHNNNNEEQASLVSDIELSSDNQQISDELQDLASFWSQLEGYDSTGLPNSDNIPSMDDLSTPELFPTSQEQPEEQEEGYISVDLWNFRDN